MIAVLRLVAEAEGVNAGRDLLLFVVRELLADAHGAKERRLGNLTQRQAVLHLRLRRLAGHLLAHPDLGQHLALAVQQLNAPLAQESADRLLQFLRRLGVQDLDRVLRVRRPNRHGGRQQNEGGPTQRSEGHR